MNMVAFGKIMSLTLLALLGFLLGRSRFLKSEAISGLAKLVIDVTMPAIFFLTAHQYGMSLAKADFVVPFLGGMGVSLLALGLGWIVALFLKFKAREKGAFLFLIAVGNSAFLPLPLANALWGEAGGVACTYYIFGNNVFLFLLGIPLLRWKARPTREDLKHLFLHPQGLAFAAGFLTTWLPLPAWFTDPVGMLGSATMPLAMLCTGAILFESLPLASGKTGLAIAASATRLLAVPAVALIAIKALGLPQASQTGSLVILLQAAMPSLASAGVYARRFGGDEPLASAGSLITTLFALATLPFWLSLAP